MAEAKAGKSYTKGETLAMVQECEKQERENNSPGE